MDGTIRASEEGTTSQREAWALKWRSHLDALAVRVGDADRITVIRLGKLDDAATEGFLIVPYNSKAVITKRRELTKEESRPLLDALKAMIRAPEGGQALCHEPAWGIEVLGSDGALVFRTSLCFHCTNYYVEIDKSAQWAGMPGGEMQDHVKELLTALLP